MQGIFYGVGVGPGDPGLMTLRAVRIIKENQVIALPGVVPKDTTAYQIAVQAVPELADKELLAIDLSMSKDLSALTESHKAGAEQVAAYLREGRNVIFLCLGDPSIYSTYTYLEQILREEGYKTEMISGVPSFCAAASRAHTSLIRWNESLTIVPAVHHETECRDDVNYIYMKSGKRLADLKQTLSETEKEIYCIENCGMENERVYFGLEELPDEAGYYTLVIARNRTS